jgi:hypothetical protein
MSIGVTGTVRQSAINADGNHEERASLDITGLTAGSANTVPLPMVALNAVVLARSYTPTDATNLGGWCESGPPDYSSGVLQLHIKPIATTGPTSFHVELVYATG